MLSMDTINERANYVQSETLLATSAARVLFERLATSDKAEQEVIITLLDAYMENLLNASDLINNSKEDLEDAV